MTKPIMVDIGPHVWSPLGPIHFPPIEMFPPILPYKSGTRQGFVLVPHKVVKDHDDAYLESLDIAHNCFRYGVLTEG